MKDAEGERISRATFSFVLPSAVLHSCAINAIRFTDSPGARGGRRKESGGSSESRDFSPDKDLVQAGERHAHSCTYPSSKCPQVTAHPRAAAATDEERRRRKEKGGENYY
jgi:hypothetical protein